MKRIFTLLIAGLFFVPFGLKADNWTETFDDQTGNTYNITGFTCAISGEWTSLAAGNFAYANTNMGSYAVTINDDNAGAHITTPVLNTCGTVAFKYAYINGSSTNVFVLQKSTDGVNFSDIDTHELGAAADLTYVNYSFDVNESSSTVYLRVLSDNQNAHLFIEDFSVEDYSGLPDETPPTWEATYPKAANVEDVQFDLLAQLDETSTVYYVVLDDGATAPSTTEVIAGTGSAGAAAVVAGSFTAGISETAETVTGLAVETSYDVYVVAEDDEATPNVQSAVSLVEITTVIMPDVLLKADFGTDLSPFTAVSILGDLEWFRATYQETSYAKISGYDSNAGAVQDNDDYLISPAIDLDGSTENRFSFLTAKSNHSGLPLQVLISTNFAGTYDAAAVGNATWTDITTEFNYSGGSYAWVESGSFDLAAYSGTVYIAFKYLSNPTDGAATWQVDDFMVKGVLPAGSDATLSDLMVDGTSVTGFEAATPNYKYELPAGTTTVPTVTYTTTDDNATAVVTPATDLSGDAAARTTTVEVTAQDGTTIETYEILFNPVLEVATIAELRASADETRTYRITGEVTLTHQDGFRNKKYVQDATAAVEIDDDPGVITTSYNIGDGITGLEGKLNDYYGFWQFNPSADPGAATSNDNVVDVQVLTVSEFKTNFNDYAAELVSIVGVSFPDAGGTFANGKNYKVAVGNDTTIFRSHYYDVINGIEIPKMADIQGIAIWDFSEAKIAPRVASDLIAYSSDATLSDLMVDGTSVDGFAASTLTYNVTLPVGTTVVPAVTYETSDANATADVTDATDLAGNETARTTTILVTAEDGTESTYSVVFTVQSTSVELLSTGTISVYPVPAMNEIMVKGMKNHQTIDIVNILGSKVRTIEVTNDEMRINISDLSEGVYMILSEGVSTRFVKR